METKIEKIYDEKNSELRIIVPIEKKLWKEEQTKSFNNLSKKLKLKGYRTGKVPTEIAKKMILPNQIWEDAISRLLNVAVKDAAKHIDEKKDIILDSPTYSIEKVTNDHLEIIFIYPIYPDIKIKNWEKVNIKFKCILNWSHCAIQDRSVVLKHSVKVHQMTYFFVYIIL